MLAHAYRAYALSLTRDFGADEVTIELGLLKEEVEFALLSLSVPQLLLLFHTLLLFLGCSLLLILLPLLAALHVHNELPGYALALHLNLFEGTRAASVSCDARSDSLGLSRGQRRVALNVGLP